MVSEGDDLGSDPGVANADEARLLDLQNIQTGLLGNYLRFVVDLVRPEHACKVSPGNVEAASSNRGDVLSPAEDHGVDEPFVRQGTTLGSTLSRYSNSGQFDDTDVPLHDLVDKTGKGQATVDANKLLSSVQGEAMDHTGRTIPSARRDMTDVEKAAEGSLQFRNRFAPRRGEETSGFANNPTPVSNLDNGTLGTGTTSVQREFGVYDKEADSIVMDDLKKVGFSLMLKAAGWDDAESPGDSKFFPRNASSDDNDLNNDSPISPRLIDPAVLRAKNALGAPSIDAGDLKGMSARAGRGDLLTHDDITDSAKSYGSTYTSSSQFDSDVIRAQAIAAVVALLEASRIFFDLISASIADEQALYPGPYIHGQGPSAGLNEKFNLLKKLVITPTDYPYDKCVLRGLQIFFTDNKKPSSSEGLGSDKRAVSKSQHISEAPSYWLAIARTILRGANDMGETYLGTIGPPPTAPTLTRNSAIVQRVVRKLGENKIFSLLNVAATVGDVSFRMAGGSDDFSLVDDQVGPWNVDRLPDSPSTRISKSRSGDGNTALSLAWRGNSVPALYMVPKNVIKASIEMGTVGAGTNPLKGMMGSTLVEKTYLDGSMEGANARIPSDIVQRMEDTLDAEYVPFYFHDIRTNEILTFHAFLDNLRDAYSPNYSGDVTGYGRMDAVKMYAGTRRKINLSFYAVSTSKQDFDEMWFKINKLVTLVYPKWTQGDMVKVGEGSKFIQPFSQVLGASPIIRLRVGDVIKSNYSKFNLSRMFGIGDSGVSPKTQGPLAEIVGKNFPTISNAISKVTSFLNAASEDAISINLNTFFYTLFGSPLALSLDPLLGGNKGSQIARSAVSTLLRNGFVNPLAIGTILNRMMDPDSVRNTSDFSSTIPGAVQAVADTISSNAADNNRAYGYRKFETHFLRPTMGNGYMLENDTAKKIRVVRPLKIMVLGQSRSSENKSKNSSLGGKRSSTIQLPVNKDGDNRTFRGPKRSSMNSFRTLYKVKIVDLNASRRMLGQTILVTHADIMPNPSFLFNTSVLPTMGIGVAAEALLDTLVNSAAKVTGIPADLIAPNLSNVDRFMDEDNNPIVKSFNSSRGRGLAGAITSLEFDWMEFPWEIDWNSRAPMACKITMGFDVIHDLPPGIDHSGFNRGPVYNVGSIMEYVAGDVADDHGEGSKSKYHDGNRTASTFSSIDSERGD